MNYSKVFFIVGHGGSGTTALANILDKSNNAYVHVEQPPKLCIESRELFKGELDNPYNVLKEKKRKIEKTPDGYVYGDKNQNYLTFIPYLRNFFSPKFIFLSKSPFNIIPSSYHYSLYGRGGAFNLKEDYDKGVGDKYTDWWDYSRLRPNTDSPYYNKWKKMNLIEKLAWSWGKYYEVLFHYIDTLLFYEEYIFFRIEDVCVEKIQEIYDFLYINPLSQKEIDYYLSLNTNNSEKKTGIAKQISMDDLYDKFNVSEDYLRKIIGSSLQKLNY